ncbi:MAG: glycosyltransferase [Chloroflexi bacterium]|nr:glycosyltransferase [Chloroflexota bacterium]
MQILFISRWFPYPANNGSKLRIFNLLRGLSNYHDITLVSFADQPDINPNEPELLKLCRNVHIVPLKQFNPHSFRAHLGYLSMKPRSVFDTFSGEMKNCIIETLKTNHFDLVIASEVDTAVYSKHFKHLPALLEDIEIGTLYENYAHATSRPVRYRHGLTWLKHRRYLTSQLKNFDVCTVVSDQERKLFSQYVNSKQAIEIVPNCINLETYENVPRNPKPNTMIFTGSFTYLPNYKGMIWFIEKVLPLIQAETPDAQLIITGDHANLPLPAAKNVTLTGFVDDIRTYIGSAWISLVPIWSGGGTRLKILEAMALHTPVVATEKGAEGLNLKDGEHILIANKPAAFAGAVTRLLQDKTHRNTIADNAFHLVSETYDWTATIAHFLTIVKRLTNEKHNITS